jgi:cbb3-type cytochrome oxidase maturation protein
MIYLVWLVPIALGMGVAGLLAFLWSMRNGQYDDLDGAAERVLLANAADSPLRQAESSRPPDTGDPPTAATGTGPATFADADNKRSG